MTGSNHMRRVRDRDLPAQAGFALLVTIVLSAVAAAITFALANLAYKNLILASDASQSQYAFYAADSALECALLGDKGDVSFPYSTAPLPSHVTCEGSSITLTPHYDSTSHTTRYASDWFDVNTDPNPLHLTRCARITAYKRDDNATSIFAEGLNVSCTDRSNPRALERGVKALYGF